MALQLDQGELGRGAATGSGHVDQTALARLDAQELEGGALGALTPVAVQAQDQVALGRGPELLHLHATLGGSPLALHPSQVGQAGGRALLGRILGQGASAEHEGGEGERGEGEGDAHGRIVARSAARRPP